MEGGLDFEIQIEANFPCLAGFCSGASTHVEAP